MKSRLQTKTENFSRAVRLLWIILFVAGIILWLASFSWAGAARTWRALLVSFMYYTPMAGGLVVWLAIIAAANGKWARGYEYLGTFGILLALPSTAALIALWAAGGVWGPWAGREYEQGFWLDNTFLFSRDLGGLILFWVFAWFFLQQQKVRPDKRLASFFILLYCVVFSLLAFDLVMGLDPAWHSSLFGGYFFISGLYTAVAALGLMAAWQPLPRLTFLHDVGKLILAFSLLTTYMMFSQLLPIWYENLPGEAGFVYNRMHSQPIAGVSVLLLGTVYLGPLVLLLTVQAKKNKYILGSISGLILVGMWVERWWLVIPTMSGEPVMGLAEMSIAAAFLGLWGLQATYCQSMLPGHVRQGTGKND